MQMLMFLSRTFIAAHFPHQVIFLRVSWILDIGYQSIWDISERILDCDIFLKFASHNSTFQCILGLFTGLLIVRCLYKSPTWLNCSRLNNFHSIISLKCWWSGPSWWSLLMLRSQLVIASLFLITSSLAVFSLLLWAGFDPNWSDLDNSQKSTWAIDCWWIPTFPPITTLLSAPFLFPILILTGKLAWLAKH